MNSNYFNYEKILRTFTIDKKYGVNEIRVYWNCRG